MAVKRKRSRVSTLIVERRAVVGRRKDLQRATEAALESHDPFAAHPESVGLLNPWKAGCLACERAKALAGESVRLWQRKGAVLEELADASEAGHTKRLAALPKTVANRRESPDVKLVREYCQHKGLSLDDRSLPSLLRQHLGLTQQRARRAVQKIKSEITRITTVPN